MRISFIALSLIFAAQIANAEANGDHPAIAARRVIAAQGYDYASAFYRHPAGLDFAAHASRPMVDQPSALIARPAGVEPRAAARKGAPRD